jgi:hypothetical protein
MFEDALPEKRRPDGESLSETAARFRHALDSFVEKVRQDRYVIAALLYGSLSHDTVWRKSDIDLVLIGREERFSGDFCLVENGVNIHAGLVPRSKFKQAIEGALQGTFQHSSFALSTLLFTTDDSIRAYYDNVRSVGARDRQLRLMTAGSGALYTMAKAEKWLLTRRDLSYSFLWIMYTFEHLATIEVLLHSELTGREVIPQALQLNPGFFRPVYVELIDQKKNEAVIQQALDHINQYLESKVDLLFGPILEYLREEGGIRSATELESYFKKQVQNQCCALSIACEWLADQGIIRRVPSPVRLTPKSQVVLDEAAYYYDE